MADIFQIIIYSALFGITMKIADLLDEHGLRLFKGASLLFGLSWGFFGLLLIMSDAFIASLILATVIGFLVRMKLDYQNHAMAAAIIIIGFLLFQPLIPLVFFPFFLIFISLGTLRDTVRYRSNGKKNLFNILRRKFSWLIYYDSFYYIPLVFLFSFFTSIWPIFYFAFTNSIFYNMVKFLGKKYGYK